MQGSLSGAVWAVGPLLACAACGSVEASACDCQGGDAAGEVAPSADATDGSATVAGWFEAEPGVLVLLVGTDLAGTGDVPSVRHAPADWPPAAGPWNGKGASYHPGTRRLVFETHREDIVGGSIRPVGITAAGVTSVFVAGPQTGSESASGTSVLYVAREDGSDPSCVGCRDVVDGVDGIRVFKVGPASDARPNRVVRQAGAVVYANQNKDLAAWSPDGAWILAGVEMPRHALTHRLGCSEVGMFNDLWAVSADGRTWVQLTDYQSTWSVADPIAAIPYACAQVARCPAACQYATESTPAPFGAYACSALGEPPPASGTMRPRVSNAAAGSVPGSAKVVWAERVGLAPTYVWGGVLQLASADLTFQDGLPALIHYAHHLTPTPEQPDGRGLWGNPTGATRIGAGYEAWDFSADDALVAFASDVFLSTSDPRITRAVSATSQAFVDACLWGWRSEPVSLDDATRFDPVVYPYDDNGFPGPVRAYGHWEEPTVFSRGETAAPWIAFATSANLDPPWSSAATFALETWIVRRDRSAPARRLTFLADAAFADRRWTYPTAVHADERLLYLTVVIGEPGGNAPGSIYALRVPAL